jgi:ribonucleoside-diphosphate reductase alpha chain
VVRVFTRMLDNVVEVNGLPLQQQRDEIMRKRRHGMGFLGLGSAP